MLKMQRTPVQPILASRSLGFILSRVISHSLIITFRTAERLDDRLVLLGFILDDAVFANQHFQIMIR
jgi:hypothetical protein